MAEQDKSNLVSASEARKQLRDRLATKKAQSDIANGIGTSQVNPEEGAFSNQDLKQFHLLAPPYDPVKLIRIVENSTMLGTCIETYQENIDGYGHEFRYLGDKQNEENEEVQAERTMLRDFFTRVNETQSFKQLRKELRFDYEATGNAFIEIVRFPTGQIATLYRADSRYIRLQKKQSEYQQIKVSFPRNGGRQEIRVNKRFRKYAMIVNTIGGSRKSERIRWFKEYGDPRRMDAKTGRYDDELETNEEIEEEANELLHWKQGNDTYGIPRWAGILPVVLGVNKADYVNYDLFDSNAIPALAVLVSGGYLTQESVEDIGAILEGQKGVENWHKFAILEAISTNMDQGNVDDKPTNTTVDLQELNKPNDAEFGNYISSSESRIRSKFRLPPIQVGQAESYSRSCYSEDTQTLTENGWKYYWEIEEGEKIATYNPETNGLEYHEPVGGLLLYDYEGQMIHFNNGNSDILVTPDHKMWYNPVSNGPDRWRKDMAKNMLESPNRAYFRHAPDNLQETEDTKFFTIPQEPRIGAKDQTVYYRNIEGDFFVDFVGRFVGDGGTYSVKNQYYIALGACKKRKKDNYKNIGEVFKNKYGMNVCYSHSPKENKEVVFISDKGLRNWLRTYCGDRAINKKLPEEMLWLNKRQSNLLLNSMIETDGHWTHNRPGRNSGYYSTTSPTLANQVQTLATRCGYRTQLVNKGKRTENSNPIYCVSLTPKNYSQIHKDQISIVNYRGKVYCFEVPNHLFFTRRKGKIAIQGNTADSSKLVSEEQVFRPEREDFDEFINFTLMEELGTRYFQFHTIGPKMMEGQDVLDAYAKMARGGALSVNDGVRIANRVLDLDMTEYQGEWANMPVSLIQELIKRGHITGIDGVGLASSSENDNEDNQDNSDDNPDQKALAPNLELDSISDDISELNEKIDSVYSLISNLEIDNSGFE